MFKVNILLLYCIVPALLFAQKSKDNYVFDRLNNIEVDGDLSDWKQKFYHDESDLWSYAITQKDNKLYVAMVVNDESLQMEALRNGFLFNISYNQKKKDGAKILFPNPDRERIRALIQDEDRNPTNVKHDLLSASHGYWVKGFQRVRDGLLSFDNDYGLKVISKIENKYLIYEAVVPLDLIKLESPTLAVQVGIITNYSKMKGVMGNQPVNNMRIYGRGPVMPSIKNPYKEPTEVWIIDIKK